MLIITYTIFECHQSKCTKRTATKTGRLIQCEAEVYHLEMEGKEMRKRIVSSLLLGCALLTGGVSTAYTVHAEDSQTQTGTATIILVNNCDWEDSSGFQFLLDEDHDTYGDVIPDSGPLSRNDDVPSSVYDRFEYKIPGNADGARDTQNSIPYGSSAKITIPSGTYDYVITNPTPDDRVWIVGNGGTDKARMDDYVFEAGKVYTYTVSKVGSGDGVYLSIHEHSYSNSIWNSDESGHWQECDDTNCPDKASSVTAKTAHISNDCSDSDLHNFLHKPHTLLFLYKLLCRRYTLRFQKRYSHLSHISGDAFLLQPRKCCKRKA